MTCITEQKPYGSLPLKKTGLWHKFFFAFWRKGSRRARRLDPQELTDHMRRDLGFLDGRSVRGR